MKFSLRLWALTLLPGFLACGIYKDRDDRVVLIEKSIPAESSAHSSTTGSQGGELDEFIQFYSENGSFSRTEIENLLAKYRPLIEQRISGANVRWNELLDLVFAADQAPNGNSDGRIDMSEINKAVDGFPATRWISMNDRISRQELRARLREDHPGASRDSVDGYVDALFSFSKDRDQLERKDALVPAMIVSTLLDKVSFQDDLSKVIGRSQQGQIMAEAMHLKLSQQLANRFFNQSPFAWQNHIFSRPTLVSTVMKAKEETPLAIQLGTHALIAAKVLDRSAAISEVDIRLEWMQTVLRYLRVDQLMAARNGKASIDHEGRLMSDAETVLHGLGIPNPVEYRELIALYDHTKSGGKWDYALDTLEMFHLWTDILYARSVEPLLDRLILSGYYRGRVPLIEQLYLLDHLMALYPSVGKTLFLDLKDKQWPPRDGLTELNAARIIRWDFWRPVRTTPTGPDGTRAGSVVSIPNFLKLMGDVRIMEVIFRNFDLDRNQLMDQDETQKFLEAFGYGTDQIVRLFMLNSDALRDLDNYSEMEDVLRGKPGPKELNAWEFLERFRNLGI